MHIHRDHFTWCVLGNLGPWRLFFQPKVGAGIASQLGPHRPRTVLQMAPSSQGTLAGGRWLYPRPGPAAHSVDIQRMTLLSSSTRANVLRPSGQQEARERQALVLRGQDQRPAHSSRWLSLLYGGYSKFVQWSSDLPVGLRLDQGRTGNGHV